MDAYLSDAATKSLASACREEDTANKAVPGPEKGNIAAQHVLCGFVETNRPAAVRC
jgi:hypothetical protein